MAVDVPVIALASLIVISHDALADDDIREPILESMRGWRYQLMKTPHNNLNKCIGGNHDAATNQQHRFHAEDNSKARGMLSIGTTD